MFGPGERFPYAPERKYTPCDASKEKLWALRDFLGFERNVIVQATCHGADNRAVVDALRTAGDRARGVATVTTATTDAELAELDAAGVRGVRFNFVKRLVDVTPPDVLAVHRPSDRGARLARRRLFRGAPICPISRISFASCRRPSSSTTWDAPTSRNRSTAPSSNASCELMRTCPRVWTKVTCPDRLSASGPPHYTDFVPFARRLVEEFPDRVLWGTDWPHPNLRSHMPDDGQLVDLIPAIAPTRGAATEAAGRQPAHLYWGRQEA